MKDLKYIIKRVIIGVLIAIILMTIKSINANALIQSQILTTASPYLIGPTASGLNIDFSSPKFQNFGQGNITFTFNYGPSRDNNSHRNIRAIWLTSNTGSIYLCELGSLNTYWDTSKQNFIITAVCPVDVTNSYISSLHVSGDHQTTINQGINIYFSQYWTFSSNEVGSYDRIINAISASTVTQANYIEVNSQKIVDAIQSNNTQIIQQQQQINQNITNINDNITNDSPAGNSEVSQALDPGILPGGGAISSILTLPLTLLNQLLSVLGISCTDAIIPLPFVNENITYECVDNIFNKLGFSTQWEATGVIAGAIILYKYLLYLYDRVNHILFLEDKGDLRRYY